MAAMLVALPSAMAFGVTIFSSLGSDYMVVGALAGMLGATALGVFASTFGGTDRLITAPSAPATAVLSAFALELVHRNVPAATVMLLLVVVALLCGALQILFGVVRLGRLIKYMPFPVVSGYLTGVGLIIIFSQTPKLLGVDRHFLEALTSPHLWKGPAVVVGCVTIAVMSLTPRITKAVPSPIVALAAGMLSYFAYGLYDPGILTLNNNPLVIGAMSFSHSEMVHMVAERWRALSTIDTTHLAFLLTNAVTLSVLLSIDTLKTCVVLDAVTRSRHNSNRELIGQGIANVASAAIGGVPGSGTMGATLVNISSGAKSRKSGILEGALALAAFLMLRVLISWVPVAALAGILIVVAAKMFDFDSLRLLKSRSTILDFVVIVAVVIVAETVSLIAASGVGIGLAIVLFIRGQIGGTVVRRKLTGAEIFSHRVRLPSERALLEQHGAGTIIFELQGNLFFGTADQLYTSIEPEIQHARHLILDLRRVESIDVTAIHTLEILHEILEEQGRRLIFSHLPSRAASGQNMQQFLDQAGLLRPDRPIPTFDHLHDALEWVEDRILSELHLAYTETRPLELREIEIFRTVKSDTFADLEACLRKACFKAGDMIFQHGDGGRDLFLIRRGSVRILLPLSHRAEHHVATFSRGDFFGEVSFLDGGKRSADAMAFTDTDVFVLSREQVEHLMDTHKKTAMRLLEAIATTLAIRLRNSNSELLALKED